MNQVVRETAQPGITHGGKERLWSKEVPFTSAEAKANPKADCEIMLIACLVSER